MPLPTAYLTSTKNLESILQAIRNAKAPERFTTRFLEELGFKSSSDRLVIGVLKSLGFLNDAGAPTDRYYRFLDESQWQQVLAEGVQDAYADLFQINVSAHKMSGEDVKNKLKTLTEGQHSDAVLAKMAKTFTALTSLGNFKHARTPKTEELEQDKPREGPQDQSLHAMETQGLVRLQGLVYNIELVLPESRDPAVYDALFKSLRQHLS